MVVCLDALLRIEMRKIMHDAVCPHLADPGIDQESTGRGGSHLGFLRAERSEGGDLEDKR